eukprot:TRINITY_DN43370_c0_g1_i1.p1 TRINITY_DN43370_c0_g1~~TRINITY_DN43370_c0_g1_i1.p1  ORF type:complete len:292 (+),score=31.39 TRINITY_DN43370_c0_g1_i1:73-948(+)
MAKVEKVADLAFRYGSAGRAFGNLMSSLVMSVCIQAVLQRYIVQPWAGSLDTLITEQEFNFLLGSGVCTFAFFWVCGIFMALPALLHVQHWKIQMKHMHLSMLAESLPVVLLNSLGFVPSGIVLKRVLPAESFSFANLPSIGTLTVQIAVVLVVQELLFFYSHRWLHVNKQMYARVHKLHHTWTAPISLVAIYAHPFEHVVSNVFPPFAGCVLVRAHFATMSIHTVLGLAHTLAVHSGYFFCDDHGMHDEHHRSFNVNYGVFGVLDWLHGTYVLPPTAAAGHDSTGEAKSK